MIAPVYTLSEFLISTFTPSRLGVADSTLYQYGVVIRVFERWAGRELTIYDLSEDLLRRFLSDYSRTGVSPSSVNNKRRHLISLWHCAADEGLIESPHTRRIPRMTEPAPIPEAWTVEEVSRVIAACPDCWWEALCLILYDTGARISEVLALTTNELRDSHVVFLKTKQSKPRLCELHQDTLTAIERIPSDRRRGLVLFWWPYSRRWLDDTFRGICRNADVAFGRPRGGLFSKMRKTSGTLVEANGGSGDHHLGNTRAVFLKHYMDPRQGFSQLGLLPRPILARE